MAESRIRIKLGQIEIEHEGTEAFIKEELPELVKAFTALHNASVAAGLNPLVPPQQPNTNPPAAGGLISLTTNSIAAKLNCADGPDLIMAAAAQYHFFKGKADFSRKELLSEMKEAKNYYKETYSSNLSAYLKTLVKAGKLHERTTNNFALSSASIPELAAKLN